MTIAHQSVSQSFCECEKIQSVTSFIIYIYCIFVLYQGNMKCFRPRKDLHLLSITFLFCEIGTHITKMNVNLQFDEIINFLYKVITSRIVLCFAKRDKIVCLTVQKVFVLDDLFQQKLPQIWLKSTKNYTFNKFPKQLKQNCWKRPLMYKIGIMQQKSWF